MTLIKAKELNQQTTQMQEDIAAELFALERVQELIQTASMQGLCGVRIAQNVPVSFKHTRAAAALLKVLKTSGFGHTWEQRIYKETQNEQNRAPTGGYILYDELWIEWGDIQRARKTVNTSSEGWEHRLP